MDIKNQIESTLSELVSHDKAYLVNVILSMSESLATYMLRNENKKEPSLWSKEEIKKHKELMLQSIRCAMQDALDQ